jgi:leader peptidase (prepilin peptidase) / N-methyltransferase
MVTFQPWMAFLLGLLVGSFLNVCIYRLPRELNAWKPARSFCPHCGATIAWYDNIPVVSYVLLRGRCRHCGATISWRYPVVELLTALLFAVVASLGLPGLYTLKLLVLMAILVTLLFTDLEERFLPDAFTLGGAVVGLAFAWIAPFQQGAFLFFFSNRWGVRQASLVEAAVAAILLSGALYVLGELYYWIRKREGLGLGDVKMLATLGAFLGLQGAMFSLAAASLFGCVFGLIYMLWNRKDFSSYELPLGSFLALAGIGVTFFLLPVIAPR